MSKVAFVLDCEVNGFGIPPDPNPVSFNLVLKVSDTIIRDVETYQELAVPMTQLNTVFLDSKIRQRYNLGPLVPIDWPFNAKGL